VSEDFSGSHTCFSQPVQVCNRIRSWSLVAVVAEEGEGVVDGGGSGWAFGVVRLYVVVKIVNLRFRTRINLVCNTPRQTCVLWAELWFVATIRCVTK
jgi:hypothetical protein